jgi:hypothetical protein
MNLFLPLALVSLLGGGVAVFFFAKDWPRWATAVFVLVLWFLVSNELVFFAGLSGSVLTTTTYLGWFGMIAFVGGCLGLLASAVFILEARSNRRGAAGINPASDPLKEKSETDDPSRSE